VSNLIGIAFTVTWCSLVMVAVIRWGVLGTFERMVELAEAAFSRIARGPRPTSDQCGCYVSEYVPRSQLVAITSVVTGEVIDWRCPRCWLPKRPIPLPPRGSGEGVIKA